MNKLTDCFHVVIKLVAVNKSPVSNKLLNHDGEGEADVGAADKEYLNPLLIKGEGTEKL